MATEVAQLLEQGADPFAVDGDGVSAVSASCQAGHAVSLKHLLTAAAQRRPADGAASAVQMRSRRQGAPSPLVQASSGGHVACVKLLLEAGANPHTPRHQRLAPWQWASSSEVAQLLSPGCPWEPLQVPMYARFPYHRTYHHHCRRHLYYGAGGQAPPTYLPTMALAPPLLNNVGHNFHQTGVTSRERQQVERCHARNRHPDPSSWRPAFSTRLSAVGVRAARIPEPRGREHSTAAGALEPQWPSPPQLPLTPYPAPPHRAQMPSARGKVLKLRPAMRLNVNVSDSRVAASR
jgi:hypothetical protein